MRSSNFRRIRHVILRRVLLVPFVVVILVFGTLVYFFATNLRTLVESRLVRIADGHRALIDQFLEERSFDIQYVAASNSFQTLGDEAELAKICEQLQRRSRAFFDIGVFDADGNHVAYIGPYDLIGKNYAQTEWFQHVKEQPVYISDVVFGYRNSPHFVIAVSRQEGDRTWYLRSTIDWFVFNDLVENVQVGKTGEAYIVNRDGIFQTRRRSGGDLMNADPDFSAYRTENGAITYFTARNASGESYLYAAGRIELAEWMVIVRQEAGDAFAPLVRAVLIAVTMIIAGGVVAVSMAFMLASGVSHKLSLADEEKRRMGTQLIMAGKLAEIGEMSAGVAHEINNPLQVIKGEEAFMRDILDDVETNTGSNNSENIRLLRESIDQIALQVERGRQITEGLLGFARKAETKIEMIDVRSLVPEIVGLIERRAQVQNVRIIQEFDADLPHFRSDPHLLQQVFLNLLNNAVDALKHKGGGEIRVKASTIGEDTVIAVEDNGGGIPPENMEKIFLPFFTTKPVGEGTGLGLSTCYGIVDRLGGQITVTSELNVGTVFTIRLPLAGAPEQEKSFRNDHKRGTVAERTPSTC